MQEQDRTDKSKGKPPGKEELDTKRYSESGTATGNARRKKQRVDKTPLRRQKSGSSIGGGKKEGIGWDL